MGIILTVTQGGTNFYMSKKPVVVDLTDDIPKASTSRVICVEELDLSSIKPSIPIVDLETIELPLPLANEDVIITRHTKAPERNSYFIHFFRNFQTKMCHLFIRPSCMQSIFYHLWPYFL